MSPHRTGKQLRLDRALGAALALLAVPATLAVAPPASAAPARFRAPDGPLLLTREIRRTLADGQQLIVRRRYLVRFEANASGYTVTGNLAGVDVDAPDALADLAEVERQRADAGIFPLQLDAAGMIVGRPAPAETVDATRARAAMAAYLSRTDLSPAERATAQTMALKLQAQAQGQATGNSWPADLFRPAPGERNEQREVALPDGRSGKVTVTIAASDRPDGLMAQMERRVVTALDGSERLSLERWTLADAR